MASPVNTTNTKRKYLWNIINCDPDADYAKVKGQQQRATQNDNSDNSTIKTYIMKPTMGSSYIVDVVNDYAWTKSPKEARNGTPFIQLREMHQKRGAELQKWIYYITGTIDSVGSLVKGADNLASNTISDGIDSGLKSLDTNVSKLFDRSDKTSTFTKNLESLSSPIAPTPIYKLPYTPQTPHFYEIPPPKTNYYEAVKTYIKEQIPKIKKAISEKSHDNKLNSEHLKPYDMLYMCAYTGWSYKFPIFENKLMETTSNDFGDGKTGGILGSFEGTLESIAKFGTGIVNTFRSLDSSVQSNLEPPKTYNFSQQGNIFTIKFPLFNTGTIETAYQNYDFIQLLKYQSRPYKCDRVSIIPVHIYEVTIPGVKYLPYAFIKNVEIDFIGVRRVLPIDIMVDGKPKNTTFVCPETYEVTITMQSLTNETQNFMIESLLNEQQTYTPIDKILL